MHESHNNMKKIALLAAAVLVGFTYAETTFTVDKTHSNIGFKVRHLGLSFVNGDFNDYEARVTVDPSNLTTLKAEAVIQVASIDTENDRRDGHLKSPDFFDAENHPTIVFSSKEVRNLNGGEFELVGDLTIRGTTKEIVLDVEYVGSATMGDAQKVAFEAEGRINRFDYGLQWNSLTEAGGLIVGEEVRLILELEATTD